MEAAVPFALLSGVQLLCVVAAVALAATSRIHRPGRSSAALLVAGGVFLAVAHGTVATALGEPVGDTASVLRTVGYLLVAAALAVGGPGLPALPVVAPIGASAGPAALATGAALVAAAASWRTEPRLRRWLAPGFAAAAAAEALSAAAVDDDRAAVAVLLLRGAWAILVFAALTEAARGSVRVKVVGAIVAAVLATAVGASAVTGTVVTSGFNESQHERITAVGRGEVESLHDTAELNSRLSLLLAECLVAGGSDTNCAGLFSRFRRESVIFTPRFDAQGRVVCTCNLEPAAALALGGSDFLAEVLRDGGSNASLLVLTGAEPRMYAVGATAIRSRPQEPIRGAAVYATAVDGARLAVDAGRAGYDLTVIDTGGAVLATTLASEDLRTIRSLLAEEAVVRRLGAGDTGVVVDADGSRPAVRYTALRDARGDLIAVLALSAPSGQILRTQRSVLRVLFGTTLLIGLLAAALALLLARRITRPIESLTATATRIRGGDLAATSAITSTDEVGTLARAFDAMTRSLRASNDELRDAVAEQSTLRARLETILDSMGDGLVITGADGVVAGMNPVAETLLGITEAEGVGRPLPDIVVGTAAAGVPLHAAPTGASTGTVRRPDGTQLPVSVVRTPLRDGDGTVLVLRDTTRESQVERMKTEFLSNVSHELRTPLTPIRGYADVLRRRPDLPAAKAQEYATSIVESSVRMSRVVDLLVDVAALEAGRVVASPAAIDVASLVDARVQAWQRRAPQLELRPRVAAGLPQVLVDAEWVGKAVDELVDNAVKHGDGGLVTLAASRAGDRVRLAVRDAGPGIPRAAQRTLFTDFEQVDGSATRQVGGLGLGLSFVRRVADEFGLGLGMTSTPGRGATFWLDLPAAGPASATRPRRAAPRRPARRSRSTRVEVEQ